MNELYFSEHDIVARTLYGEARGEYHQRDGGLAALIAIANIIVNRAGQKTWYGLTFKDVCLKPYQFSCWNQGDPNRSIILSVTDTDDLFRICIDVTQQTLNGHYPDLTMGSDHYYSLTAPKEPPWAQKFDERIRIGRHRFFKSQSA
jgi:spore germination cell wall hydrolase CwlJ-like protein